MKSMRIIRRVLVAAAAVFIYFKTFLASELFPRALQKEYTDTVSSIGTTITTANPTYLSGPYGRIAFRLHKLSDMTVNPPGKYDPVPKHQCRNSSDLTSTLSDRGVLDFKVSISTDLNMIFIGDSIASQLSQAFDATVLEPHYDYNSNSVKRHFHNSQHFPEVAHICVTESAPIRGGGVSAYMRHNLMISSSSMKRRGVCGHGSKLWGLDVVDSLLDYQYQHPVSKQQHRYKSDNQSDEEELSHRSTRVGRFNAAILKIPALGWIKDINSVTKEAIIEEIDLVGKYFGVETVIISTLTFSNNVKTLDDWEGIQKVNEMIRQIAKSWEFSPTKGISVRLILVQELANFTNQLIWTNAKHMGYDVDLDFSINGWDGMKASFLLDRFERVSKYFWPPSIPMVCSKRPNVTNVRSCVQNKISPDGGHWCTPTLGPRYSASIACLLGCVYNGESGYLLGVVDTFKIVNKSVRVCEDECNQRFMSLVPVDDEWIDDGATLYSRSSP